LADCSLLIDNEIFNILPHAPREAAPLFIAPPGLCVSWLLATDWLLQTHYKPVF
jgi:hypothetical protein